MVALTWLGTKQKCVMKPSCEAEIIALYDIVATVAAMDKWFTSRIIRSTTVASIDGR